MAAARRVGTLRPVPGRRSSTTVASVGFSRTRPDRGALTGAMIAGVFGIAWTQWGASGLSGSASATVRVVGSVVGVVIVARSGRLRRSSPPRSESLFGSPAYWLVLVAELVALIVGAVILGTTGHSEYVSAWFATVVGVHFAAFGHFFQGFFYWLGAAFLVAGIAGALVGVTGGGRDAIEATAGLISAASLFAVGGWSLLKTRPPGLPNPSQ